jgi:hypothetical protein
MFTRRETLRYAATTLAATLVRGQNQPGRVSVSFDFARDRGSLLIRANVDRKSAVLIVDTGSSHTIVRPALVGVNPAELSRARSGAGVIGDAIGREVTLEVGDQVWPRRRVSVMDLTQVLAAYNERIDGLLGLDFLLEFSEANFNLKDRVVTFVR